MTPEAASAVVGHVVVVGERAETAGGVITLPAEALEGLGVVVDRARAFNLYVLLHETSHAVDQDAGSVYTCPGSEEKANRRAARLFLRFAAELYQSVGAALRLWRLLPETYRYPGDVACPKG